MRMLVKAIPILQSYLSQLTIIDIHVLHHQVSSLLDAKSIT